MAGTLYDLIPGLRETEGRFREEQLEAFVGIELPIAGFEILPFTPRMFLELDGVGNDFLSPVEAPRVEHLAMFVWRVSAEFDRLNIRARRRFLRRFRRVPYGPAVTEVRAYLRRTHAPMPSLPGGADSVASWASLFVHVFAHEYGWIEAAILDMPFRRLWQYLNRIIEFRDPKYKQQCQAAIKLRADWLAKQNERKT